MLYAELFNSETLVLKYFTTGIDYILPMAICRQLITNCSKKLLNHVSGKVLTHHTQPKGKCSAKAVARSDRCDGLQ
jgi:hypothetical protein